MNCHETQILLATRRDLAPEQERTVQRHLEHCATCAAAWQREQETSQLLQALQGPTRAPVPPLRLPVRRRFRWGLTSARLAVAGMTALVLLMLWRYPIGSITLNPPTATALPATPQDMAAVTDSPTATPTPAP